MHWFWRAVVAVTLGIVWYEAFEQLLRHLFNPWLIRTGVAASPRAPLISTILFGVNCTILFLVPIAAYGFLTRRYYRSHPPLDETRCRKRSYILRGLTEPRCPECGEQI